jgi:hypothetical protein
VFVHIGDEWIIGGDNAPHLVDDSAEPVLNRALNGAERICQWR